MGLEGVLVVRLGAMGDVIHTLPALPSLQPISWLIKPKWAPLIEGNPYVREVLTSPPGRRFEAAYDFQGLMKSAYFAWRGAAKTSGFRDPREWPARLLYSNRVARRGAHVVEHNLALAGAAAPSPCWLPEGREEGRLPAGPFLLACPSAGWRNKEWPMENWSALQSLSPLPLILNGPPGSGLDHESSIPGLIHATRRALGVVGLDSGPLHLAAALGKPGVAIYGPTDPARNGPFGGSIKVLRHPSAVTSYKRRDTLDPSMQLITPREVAAALREIL